MVEEMIPANERERLETLLSYEILDTPNEKSFDDITALAAERCRAPMAFVTLVDRDREWFKSTFGAPAELRQLPRRGGFCATAIITPHQPLIVEDASKDPRFADDATVAGDFGLRFYAGIPIVDRDGFALGALSVVDRKPRTLSDDELSSLKVLTGLIADQLELRRLTLDVETAAEEHEHLRGQLDSPQVISATSLEATLSNAGLICDRLGRRLRSALEQSQAGDRTALEDFATKTTHALQELLAALSLLRKGAASASAASSALDELAKPPAPSGTL